MNKRALSFFLIFSIVSFAVAAMQGPDPLRPVVASKIKTYFEKKELVQKLAHDAGLHETNGGKFMAMNVFIDVSGEPKGFLYVEDGHVSYHASFEYEIVNDQVKVSNLIFYPADPVSRQK